MILTYEPDDVGLLFVWEGGEYINILTRSRMDGAEYRDHQGRDLFPGWWAGTEVIGGMWDNDRNERAAPFTQDTLEAEAREWLGDNGFPEFRADDEQDDDEEDGEQPGGFVVQRPRSVTNPGDRFRVIAYRDYMAVINGEMNLLALPSHGDYDDPAEADARRDELNRGAPK